MTVTNFTEDDDGYFIEVVGGRGTHYTFMFYANGGSGAKLESIITDGFKIAPIQGRERTEAYAEARRYLLNEVESVEDTWVPSQATTVFNND